MFLLNNPILIGIAVVIATVLLGLNDFVRFRMRRVNAIAGVCFAESIRRRILWITPLAIVGVVVVSALQKPMDEQDAIRQTTKYCLFATGLIVTVAAILLACTNLPKEIENRVIFTIVTKPVTRLEIVVGKVLGFASVSALILVIMGGFTWGYLQIRSATLMSRVRTALESKDPKDLDPGRRSTLEHYQNVGLLSAKSLELPTDLEVAAEPFNPWDKARWVAGGQAQYYSAPFSLTEDERKALIALLDPATNPGGVGGVAIAIQLDVIAHPPTPEEKTELKQGVFPTEVLPQTPGAEATAPKLIPQIGVQITSSSGAQIAKDVSLEKRLPDLKDPKRPRNIPSPDPTAPPGTERMLLLVPLTASAISDLANLKDGNFSVEVQGITPTIEYGAGEDSTRILVFGADAGAPGAKPKLDIRSSPWGKPGTPAVPKVTGRMGRSGVQLIGRSGGRGSVAVYRFKDVEVPPAVNGKVALQVKLAVERGGELDAVRTTTSELSVQVRNHKSDSGYVSPPTRVQPETGLAQFVDVPVQAVLPSKAGEPADFDVILRGMTPGSNYGLQGQTSPTPSVTLATADHSFTFNLFKSLLILWLLSVLVVAISVFCSTFLSWPIAIVLTLLLLMSRWGVEELGPSLEPGGSRGVASDLFGIHDASKETAITDSLEVLATVLRNAVKVLPDVSRFPAFEDIERGVDIRPRKLGEALAETAGFGVPLILLTYLVLRRKEVAP